MAKTNLTVSVDVMNLELFQDLLKATTYLYELADQETREEVVKIMSNHGSLVLITKQEEGGNEYDGESDEVLKRINKVNDLIEAELTKP